jgi:hypothetical protein
MNEELISKSVHGVSTEDELARKPNRLTTVGRERCAATGRTNISAWNERREAELAGLAKLADETREALLAELGPSVSIAQRLLVESTVASTLAIRAITASFLRGKPSSNALGDLSRVQSQAARNLRALALLQRDPEPESQDDLDAIVARITDGRTEMEP